MSAATATAPALDARVLVVRLGAPHAVLSWAIVNGGRRSASEVAWVEVRDEELRPPVDPERLLRERLARSGVPGAVGLLTSRALSRHVVAERSASGVAARCVATVGLGNALRAGDLAGPAARIGTINVLCQLSVPLTDEALVEALSLAAEARTLAVLEAGVASRRSGLAATGTGTDCIVVAAPADRAAVAQRYAGKHTAVGHVVGAAVHEAVARGAAEWLAERAAAAARGAGA
ncbi:MAG: adenosylcobinamide amidohydrolase [Anaeromyxobacteraceae bacterium]